jgi:hypothetical protein
MTDHAHDAQRAAETHLEECYAFLNDEDGCEEPDELLAPFCGCFTCQVRETLVAAWPHLRALALEEAADELERRMERFPMGGRHTRAAWAVAVLRRQAEEGGQ